MSEIYAFSKVIKEVEARIGEKYLPGCIKYIDDTYDGAWSKAMDRFEAALNSHDFARIQLEAEIYGRTMLTFIERYNRTQVNRGVEDLLTMLKMTS